MSEFFGGVWSVIKLVFGALLVLLGLVGAVAGLVDGNKDGQRLETHGIVVAGKITRLDRRQGIRTRRQTGFGIDKWEYVATYEWRAKDGKSYNDDKKFNLEQYEELKVGDRIDVLYLPERPAFHRLTSYEKPYGPVPLSAVIGAVVIFGGWGSYLIWRNGPRVAAMFSGGGSSGRTVDLGGLRGGRGSAPAAPAPRRVGGGPAGRGQGFGQRGRA